MFPDFYDSKSKSSHLVELNLLEARNASVLDTHNVEATRNAIQRNRDRARCILVKRLQHATRHGDQIYADIAIDIELKRSASKRHHRGLGSKSRQNRRAFARA